MIEKMIGMDELPLPVKLIVAFVIVLALIVLVLWVIRRMGAGGLGATPARGRQPRLAVIDAAAVDNRRRLVLIRRDNVEHLIMIGGPTDVVVEQNIVRAVPVAPPREAQAPRAAPEPSLRATSEPVQRGPIEPPRTAPTPERPIRAVPQPAPRPMRVEPARPVSNDRPRPQSIPTDPEPSAVEMQSAPPTADANLADMAQKLEAALRRPPVKRVEPIQAETPPTLFEPPPPTAPEAEASTATQTQLAAPAATPSASAAENKPTTPPSNAPASVFDSLEEEMASLLAKPPAKT